MSRIHNRSFPWLSAMVAVVASITLLGCSGQNVGPGERAARRSDMPVATAPELASGSGPAQGMDYDPWESFNQETFAFNHDVADRYALKPAATAWDAVLPYPVRQSLTNAFDNLGTPRRFVNKVFQGRIASASLEIVRSLLNTTIGVAGFFDVATSLGLNKSEADTGQTLGVYGMGPGPYLVVPFLSPLTVRDGIGYAVDSLLDPLSYFAPLVANIGRGGAKTVNERAANLKLYQDVEDTSLDLYAAVRNGYLQRRQKSIENAIRDRSDRSATSVLSNPQDTPAAQPVGVGRHTPSTDARNEFLKHNRKVATDIRQAYLTSNYSPAAESDYIAGQQAFRNGNYQQASQYLQEAETQLKGFPNRSSLD